MRNAFFNSSAESVDPIHLSTCGYENCVENFCCNTHIRDYHLIHYIVEGEGFYETAGKKYKVCEGDIFVIYPGELVKYYAPYTDKKWTFAWIGFSGSNAEHYLSKINIDRNNLVSRRDGNTFVKEILECLKYINGNRSALSQMILDGFALKCLAALETDRLEKNRSLDCGEVYSNMAVQYIVNNYMTGINISDLTSYLNINRSYFYKIFKRNTGCSPQSFLINYRLERAKDLLRRGYSVTETAEAVGFSNIYSFSVTFKKKFGKSPVAFVKSPRS